jgi:hypothetical protein
MTKAFEQHAQNQAVHAVFLNVPSALDYDEIFLALNELPEGRGEHIGYTVIPALQSLSNRERLNLLLASYRSAMASLLHGHALAVKNAVSEASGATRTEPFKRFAIIALGLLTLKVDGKDQTEERWIITDNLTGERAHDPVFCDTGFYNSADSANTALADIEAFHQ